MLRVTTFFVFLCFSFFQLSEIRAAEEGVKGKLCTFQTFYLKSLYEHIDYVIPSSPLHFDDYLEDINYLQVQRDFLSNKAYYKKNRIEKRKVKLVNQQLKSLQIDFAKHLKRNPEDLEKYLTKKRAGITPSPHRGQLYDAIRDYNQKLEDLPLSVKGLREKYPELPAVLFDDIGDIVNKDFKIPEKMFNPSLNYEERLTLYAEVMSHYKKSMNDLSKKYPRKLLEQLGVDRTFEFQSKHHPLADLTGVPEHTIMTINRELDQGKSVDQIVRSIGFLKHTYLRNKLIEIQKIRHEINDKVITSIELTLKKNGIKSVKGTGRTHVVIDHDDKHHFIEVQFEKTASGIKVLGFLDVASSDVNDVFHVLRTKVFKRFKKQNSRAIARANPPQTDEILSKAELLRKENISEVQLQELVNIAIKKKGHRLIDNHFANGKEYYGSQDLIIINGKKYIADSLLKKKKFYQLWDNDPYEVTSVYFVPLEKSKNFVMRSVNQAFKPSSKVNGVVYSTEDLFYINQKLEKLRLSRDYKNYGDKISEIKSGDKTFLIQTTIKPQINPHSFLKDSVIEYVRVIQVDKARLESGEMSYIPYFHKNGLQKQFSVLKSHVVRKRHHFMCEGFVPVIEKRTSVVKVPCPSCASIDVAKNNCPEVFNYFASATRTINKELSSGGLSKKRCRFDEVGDPRKMFCTVKVPGPTKGEPDIEIEIVLCTDYERYCIRDGQKVRAGEILTMYPSESNTSRAYEVLDVPE
jgi:hypothetical protein